MQTMLFTAILASTLPLTLALKLTGCVNYRHSLDDIPVLGLTPAICASHCINSISISLTSNICRCGDLAVVDNALIIPLAECSDECADGNVCGKGVSKYSVYSISSDTISLISHAPALIEQGSSSDNSTSGTEIADALPTLKTPDLPAAIKPVSIQPNTSVNSTIIPSKSGATAIIVTSGLGSSSSDGSIVVSNTGSGTSSQEDLMYKPASSQAISVQLCGALLLLALLF